MADKFRVGQRVRLINAEFKLSQIGEVFTIIRPRQYIVRQQDNKMIYAYRLDDNDICEEHKLEPVYDGDEQSSWSECLWKPKPIVHSIEDEITTDTGGE